MRITWLVLLAGAAVLSGCANAPGDPSGGGGGDDGTEPSQASASPPDPQPTRSDTVAAPEPAAALDIVVTVPEEAGDHWEEEPQTGEWTLTCAPAGGDHPDPDAACALLSEVDAEVFEPIDYDGFGCTMAVEGPERATVTGTFHGTAVDAEFSRNNGCENSRWEGMGAVLDP